MKCHCWKIRIGRATHFLVHYTKLGDLFEGLLFWGNAKQNKNSDAETVCNAAAETEHTCKGKDHDSNIR